MKHKTKVIMQKVKKINKYTHFWPWKNKKS